MIQYRPVITGIPIFPRQHKNKCGRGQADGQVDNPRIGLAMSEVMLTQDMTDEEDRRSYPYDVWPVLVERAERALKEKSNVGSDILLFYQDAYLVEEIIKKKGIDRSRKIKFRQEQAGPYGKLLKLWAANAILEVPRDSLIFKALNYLIK